MNEDFLKPYDKKKNPYQVPKGYFGRKKLELLDIPAQKAKPETSFFSLQSGLVWIAGIAAAVLIGVLLYPGDPDTSPTTEITDASIEAYLREEYPANQLDEEMIFSEISLDELNGISFLELDEKPLEDFIDNYFDQTLHYEFL